MITEKYGNEDSFNDAVPAMPKRRTEFTTENLPKKPLSKKEKARNAEAYAKSLANVERILLSQKMARLSNLF
jgi:hypothetical protein